MPLPIGFFAPLPLPVMIPFMGYQSLVMGEAFGLSYQYAKRKISSMTNEEFNKLTVTDLQAMIKGSIQSGIPQMQASMDDMLTLQTKIVDHLVSAILQIPKDIYEGVTDSPDKGGTGLPPGVAGFVRPILQGLGESRSVISPEVPIVPDATTMADMTPAMQKEIEHPVITGTPHEGFVGPQKNVMPITPALLAQNQQPIIDARIAREQENLRLAGIAALSKKKLPSDPRTILSRRTELQNIIRNAEVTTDRNTAQINELYRIMGANPRMGSVERTNINRTITSLSAASAQLASHKKQAVSDLSKLESEWSF